MAGCIATNNDITPINKDKFEDYTPWWASNKNDVATNTIDKMNTPSKKEVVYYALSR